MDLGGNVALVTGGSRGLGRAICLALAAEGARVGVNYRAGRRQADEVVEAIRRGKEASPPGDDAETRPAAVALQADVTREDDVARMFDECAAALGPVDVLVNNAGVWPRALVKDMTLDEWETTVAVNLTGPFLACREAVRRWVAAGRAGTIVNVSSQAAFHGATSGHAHYAAAKAGLVTFTVSLAREVAPHGIRVNAVAPGMMTTDMSSEALEADRERYLKRIPLGRIADPAEIAAVVVFLASPRASYMTGATVNVSGGMLMR